MPFYAAPMYITSASASPELYSTILFAHSKVFPSIAFDWQTPISLQFEAIHETYELNERSKMFFKLNAKYILM